MQKSPRAPVTIITTQDIAARTAHQHSRAMKTLLLAATLATPIPALAQTSGAKPVAAAPIQWGSTDGNFSAEYTGISHGLTVLKLSGSLTLTPNAYAAHVTFHTAGLVGMVIHSDNDSTATGLFQGDRALPQNFIGSGHLRGTDRATHIEYADGNPVIRLLTPPVEQERTVVPTADTAHTIDTLSAVALLVRQVAQTGRCEGTVTTFDGRRLASQTVHTTGEENLEHTSRSSFSGPALRCDFDGRQLGGFIKNENEDDLKKPRHGTAWVANVIPGAPPVPVRVAFENKLLGQVTLYLTAVTGSGKAAVAACCSGAQAPVR